MLATNSATGVMESAKIWARAKAHRDQDPEVASAEETLPGIRRRLALENASLFLARQDKRALGFALVAPRAHTLEVFYLAVDPDAWGRDIASQLLQAVEAHARAVRRRTLELWVIDDNERATGVYEKMGWLRTQRTQLDATSGRTERRFLRDIS